MTNKRNTYPVIMLCSLVLFSFTALAQEIKVSVEAPGEVWTGDRFRVTYIIESDEDVEGEFRAGEFKGLEVLSGPVQSVNSSVSIVGGRRKISYIRNISYVVSVNKAGKYTLPKGEFIRKGKKYRSESSVIQAKSFEKIKNDQEAFVRTIVSRTNVSPGDTLSITYRLYTTMDFRRIVKADYPMINRDFYASNISRMQQAMDKEEYRGKTYNVIDLRRLILQPRNTGQKNIEAGSLTIEFGIPTGKRVQGAWGDTYEEVIQEIQTLPIEEAKISVHNLIEI